MAKFTVVTYNFRSWILRGLVPLLVLSVGGQSVGGSVAAGYGQTGADPGVNRCDVFTYLVLGASGVQYLQDTFTNRGISFDPAAQFMSDIQKAGASEELVTAARKAGRIGSAASEACPDDIYAHVSRAGALKQTGSFAGAEQEWRSALQLQPRNPMLHLGLAGVLGLLKKWPETLREAEQAAQIDPESWAAHAQIGAAYTVLAYSGERDSRLRKAATQYQEAVNLSPTNCLLHTDYAVTLLSAHEYKLANSELESSERGCPASTYTMYIRANWFADQGREKDAVRVLRLALERQPENCVVVIYLKGLLQKAGDAEGVREIEQKSKASCSGLDR